MSPVHYVTLSVILFVIGGVGVLVRRNAIVVFMCIELMLNACNLAFVGSPDARQPGGQVIAFFVMVVAAAEVVVAPRDPDGDLPGPQVRVGGRRQPAQVLS